MIQFWILGLKLDLSFLSIFSYPVHHRKILSILSIPNGEFYEPTADCDRAAV